MSKITFLDNVEVKTPCTESWDEMQGNEQIRFCSHCAKDVHNLSAMTRKRARNIVAQSNGGICIRYVRRPNGRIQTVKNTLHQITRQTGLAAGVLGASLSMSALAYAQTSDNAPADAPVVQTVSQSSDSPNGVLSGTITDPNGAVIPFAFVTLACEQTNFYHTATANQEGFYEFKDVPNGEYKLKFEAGGFASREMPQVSVGAGAGITQNQQLSLQNVAEVVQIGGEEKSNTSYEVLGGMGLMISSVRSSRLVMAVENNDFDEVKLRVGMGERVNVKDKGANGNSPLHAAAENGNLEIAEFLLNHGAKINGKNNEKQTPLMMLDEDASVELVNLFIRHGAKLNLIDKEGDTALINASGNASKEVVQALISAGANINAVNKQGETALMRAAENGENEIVQLLLGSGANANARNRDGETALSLTKNEDAKQYLIAFGGRK